MRNLISSEFWRFFRQKSTYVILVVYFVLILLSGLMTGFITGNSAGLIRLYQSLGLNDLAEEGGNLLAMYGYKINSYTDFAPLGITADLAVALLVFIVFFSIARRRHGYLKNLAGAYTRKEIFLADAAVIPVYSLMLIAAALLANLFAFSLCFDGLSAGDLPAFFVNVLLRWLLLSVCGLLSVCLFDLFRGYLPPLILGLVYFSMAAVFLFNILNNVLSLILKTEILVQKLTPFGNLLYLPVGEGGWNGYAVTCILVYGAFAFILELVLLKRKDLVA